MKAPQIIMIVIQAIETGMHLAKHGEPKEYPYNFWTALLSDAIVFGCLWWGGFFG